MASWGQRLEKLGFAEPEVESIDHWTLEELKAHRVTFGKTQMGKTFEETWNDQKWIKWFLGYGRTSQKIEHRLMMRFIQLMIEEAETQASRQALRIKPKSVAAPKSIAAPKASSQARPSEEFSEEEFEIFSMAETTQVTQQSEINDLQNRMFQLEGALQQVIQHLSTLTMGMQTEVHEPEP